MDSIRNSFFGEHGKLIKWGVQEVSGGMLLSNPGGRWNFKWTFGKADVGVFFPNSVDGVAVAWQGPFFSQKQHVPFKKTRIFVLLGKIWKTYWNNIPIPIIYPQNGWGKPDMWWANQPASHFCFSKSGFRRPRARRSAASAAEARLLTSRADASARKAAAHRWWWASATPTNF